LARTLKALLSQKGYSACFKALKIAKNRSSDLAGQSPVRSRLEAKLFYLVLPWRLPYRVYLIFGYQRLFYETTLALARKYKIISRQVYQI